MNYDFWLILFMMHYKELFKLYIRYIDIRWFRRAFPMFLNQILFLGFLCGRFRILPFLFGLLNTDVGISSGFQKYHDIGYPFRLVRGVTTTRV